MAPAALQMSKSKRALVVSVMYEYLLERVYEFRDTLSNLFFLMKYRSNLVDTSTDKAAEYTALKFA